MVKLLTAEIARELLDYDPETGIVTRKVSGHYWRVGKAIGTPTKKGYLHAWIYDTTYQLHRIAWLIVHGRWPAEQLDHINGVRNDNRLVNLRECTNAENRQNIRLSGYGQSGHLGVSPHGDGWAVNITLNGKRQYLGYFEDKEVARDVYLKAKLLTHSFVAGDDKLREVTGG